MLGERSLSADAEVANQTTHLFPTPNISSDYAQFITVTYAKSQAAARLALARTIYPLQRLSGGSRKESNINSVLSYIRSFLPSRIFRSFSGSELDPRPLTVCAGDIERATKDDGF
jgi:hypothetical protein